MEHILARMEKTIRERHVDPGGVAIAHAHEHEDEHEHEHEDEDEGRRL